MDENENKNIDILFDNNKVNYICGQLISGNIIIKLYGDILLSAIKIILRGLSEVKWTEKPGISSEGHAYHMEEILLNMNHVFPVDIRNKILNKGIHEIPFEFELPNIGIPSSIRADYGLVEYSIEAFVDDESYESDNYKIKRCLQIEAPFVENLNLSVGGGTEKNIGLLNLGSGHVRIDANIWKKGFILGERIEVTCFIDNSSTLNVTPRASLYQTQIFMAKERHKTVETPMKPVVGTEVSAGNSEEQTILVDVPNDVCLSIKTTLISIKYFIHVTLDIPHAIDLHLNLPIVITTPFALESLTFNPIN